MPQTIEQEAMYEMFQRDFPFCMATHLIPHPTAWDMDFPRVLHNAHICGGAAQTQKGETDRRNIVRLSMLCHDLAHHKTIRDKNRKPSVLLLNWHND